MKRDAMMETGLRVGTPVVWEYETRRGWGFVMDIPGVVVRFGRERVCIQVQKVDGAWVERWVQPGKLTPTA